MISNDNLNDFFSIFDCILHNHNPKFNAKTLTQAFLGFSREFQKEKEKNEISDYIPPKAFFSETIIKTDDNNKKKTWQYMKYKTIPKWHHYALDIIK